MNQISDEWNLVDKDFVTEVEFNDWLQEQWEKGLTVAKVYVNATTYRHINHWPGDIGERYIKKDKKIERVHMYDSDFGPIQVELEKG